MNKIAELLRLDAETLERSQLQALFTGGGCVVRVRQPDRLIQLLRDAADEIDKLSEKVDEK